MKDGYPFTKGNYYFVGQITPRTPEEETGQCKPITMERTVKNMRAIYEHPKETIEARQRASQNVELGDFL